MPRFSRLIAASLALAGMIPAALAQAQEPPDVLSPDPGSEAATWDDSAAVGFLMTQYGTSRQEAINRLSLQEQANVLQAAAKSAFPATFGGAWWDHSTGQLRLAFTQRPAESTALLASGFSDPSRLVGVQSHASLVELDLRKGEILSRWEEIYFNVPTIRLIDISQDSQKIVVGVDSADVGFAQRYFDQLFSPSSLITVVPISHVTADACSSRAECKNPIRGGIEIKAGGRCSAGFVAVNQFVQGRLMTAGHCSAGNYSHAGKAIGKTETRVFEPSLHPLTAQTVDAQDITFESSNTDDEKWKISRWVYANDNAKAYQMLRRARVGMVAFTILCSAGVSSGERCGRASSDTAIFFSFDENGWYGEQIMSEMCSAGGDSGGPVYGPVGSEEHSNAYGLHSHSANVLGVCRSFASRLDNIEPALQSTIVTW